VRSVLLLFLLGKLSGKAELRSPFLVSSLFSESPRQRISADFLFGSGMDEAPGDRGSRVSRKQQFAVQEN
jgi:hypothetical protein